MRSRTAVFHHETRQRDSARLDKEVERAFAEPTLRSVFKQYLLERYEIPRTKDPMTGEWIATEGDARIAYILGEIQDTTRYPEAHVSRDKYRALIELFYIVPGTNPPTDNRGYTLLEVGEILGQPWWKGVMSQKEMSTFLKTQPRNLIYVAQHNVRPNAFYTGWFKDSASFPTVVVVEHEENHQITMGQKGGTLGRYRTLTEYLDAFMRTRFGQGLRLPRAGMGRRRGGGRPMYALRK